MDSVGGGKNGEAEAVLRMTDEGLENIAECVVWDLAKQEIWAQSPNFFVRRRGEWYCSELKTS